MTPTDIERLQTYLRKLFGSDRIRIVLAVNDETIGTVHQDTDEGETSYSIHLTVLEEDLPVPPRTAPTAVKRRTTR